ncbi:glycine cleavage system protein R [Denitromonas sp.]|uniref:glycine cleavage system protein R n=1 Tax=Denitromonas sp. TaxID=2734609 RepID=UPI003A8BB932
MTLSLVITVLGPDRPGLVSALANRASQCGANWLESSMAQLAGQFAGIVRLEIAAEGADALEAALRGLETEGLRVSVERAAAPAADSPRAIALEVVGHDRPGIVRDISAVLARHGASIDRLDSHCESASFSGEPLFHAHLALHLPAAMALPALQSDLEALADDLMVDISLEGDATD